MSDTALCLTDVKCELHNSISTNQRPVSVLCSLKIKLINYSNIYVLEHDLNIDCKLLQLSSLTTAWQYTSIVVCISWINQRRSRPKPETGDLYRKRRKAYGHS